MRKSLLNNLITLGDVTIDHLFEVRLLIEPHIAREAALNRKDEHIKKLKELIEDSSHHQNNPLHLKKNNLEFHLLIAKTAGNPVLSVLLESVIELLIKTTLDFLDLSLERHFFRVHKRIAEVIAKGNAADAERFMREDILDTKEKIQHFRSR
jgi:GntR family transcriptional regulator, transcriptional repressor for pyruvate dehydrogenase complex